MTAEVNGPGDAELIEAVRAGSGDAFGTLYERHVAAAYNLARQLTRDSAAADDLVSDSFAKVLDALRAGKGPDVAFRAYLLTALRHNAYDRTRRERRVELTENITDHDPGQPFRDTAIADLERSLAARAFARLPERWQAVLWHTEIEQQSPAEVASVLGLSSNGVSALAYRAREGLRQAYLQVYLSEGAGERCRATVDRLGAWTRAGLSRRETTQVDHHLDECERCRALAAELADVASAMREIMAPIVLGAGLTAYLAATGEAKTTVLASAAGAATGGATTGGATTGGATVGAAPRQWLMATASAGALAVALAIGLQSGERPPPVAAPPPVVSGSRTPVPSPTTTTVPPVTPTSPVRPTATPAPKPAAKPAALEAEGPNQAITLRPGGSATLPITVRNTGGTESEPVTLALSLPAGITASGPPGAAEPRGRSLGPGMGCDAGIGTLRCRTVRGLTPGERVTLPLVLRAEEGPGGQITGTITAGGGIRLRLPTVIVTVRKPAPVDVLTLDTQVRQDWFWHARLDLTVLNAGTSRGIARVTVRAPQHFRATGLPPYCRGHGTIVRCEKALAPGERFRGLVWFTSTWAKAGVISVSASLGSATVTREIPVEFRGHPVPPGRAGQTPALQQRRPASAGRRRKSLVR